MVAVSLCCLSVTLDLAVRSAVQSAASFGLFGIISYIFPIVLLVGTFAVSNQGNRVAAVKLVAVICLWHFMYVFELISDGTDAKVQWMLIGTVLMRKVEAG